MKEIQTNNITILLVEVPEDAINIEIDPMYPDRICFDIKEDVLYPDYAMLPSGQYQILGKSTELSEEQSKINMNVMLRQCSNGSEINKDSLKDYFEKGLNLKNYNEYDQI